MSDSKEHKFKVGDKVVPFPTEGGYLSAYLVAGSTYTITKIRENGRVDVEGTFKSSGNGKDWDSDWFKPYEEKEVKVEKTCKFKVGDVVVCTETDSDVLEGNYLVHGQSYMVIGIDEYDKFEDSFLLKVQNIETQETTYTFESRFSLKQETPLTAESLRNSILSLQQERVSLQDHIEQNIAQEKALREQLKELDFLLVEGEEQPTNAVDEKHTLNTVKVGDMVECISTENPGYNIGQLYTEKGGLYTVSRVEYLEDVDKIKVDVEEEAGGIGIMGVNYKFLYRPVAN